MVCVSVDLGVGGGGGGGGSGSEVRGGGLKSTPGMAAQMARSWSGVIFFFLTSFI